MTLNKSGFTLIEVVIALCLITIFAGFAGPTIITAVPGIALKSAANDLASDMRLARSLSVKNQETITMSFDTVAGLYRISANTGNIKTVSLADYRGGIKFGSGEATVTATDTPGPFSAGFVSFANNDVNFTRNGMCDKYGYVYICNENNDIAYAAGLSSMAGVVRFRKTNGTDSWITL